MDSLYSAYQQAESGAPQTVPRELNKFAGFHQGETLLVCGCGASLADVVAPERFVTVGVNDVGRLFTPDYLVVLNPRTQFAGDRFRYVEESRARAIFTQLMLGVTHPNIVRFRLGRRGGTDVSAPDSLPYTRNSPYVAACLAMFMGAKRIGIIGVDLTENHFFGATGRHPLAGELAQINAEYGALAKACAGMGIEMYNLSEQSRLTSLAKMTPADFARSSAVPARAVAAVAGAKVFFVNYRFITCGDVFSTGLEHAATDLGVASASAYWDAPDLAARVEQFQPDLLLAVHGRKFARRFGQKIPGTRSAAWLLDEPYEVDDTSKFSRSYDTVFLNDPATHGRHQNAHLLPVCFDPAVCYYRPGPREYGVGFIGAANPAREQMLDELARNKRLSYVVGGPWRNPRLREHCLAASVPAREAAELYRKTQVIINVFRRAGHPNSGPEAAHHYNRQLTAGTSMAPRIYEALGCGALVISERRPEIERLCPELPVFDGPEELHAKIEGLLNDPARFDSVRTACIRRLAGHTYAHRLYTVLATVLDKRADPPWIAASRVVVPVPAPPAAPPGPPPVFDDWEADGRSVRRDEEGTVTLSNGGPKRAGSETGLVSKKSWENVAFSFEVWLEPGAHFLAKVHLAAQHDQASNSYHAQADSAHTYLARHDHVFQKLNLRYGAWEKLRLGYEAGQVFLEINGHEVARHNDRVLPSGYCFIGVKAGIARVRNLALAPVSVAEVTAPEVTEAHVLLHDNTGGWEPEVSIVTTVYDRVECLERCIRSVQALKDRKYEQIIVADAPPETTMERIRSLVRQYDNETRPLRLAVLKSRANDWGIAPATAGVRLARGRYLCFLSDDNGYTPDHFEGLVPVLENEASLGFVYSSCRYAGRRTLASPTPSLGHIDLGQPLFRRELFDQHLNGVLPYRDRIWDWRMIQQLMRSGVRWRHIDRPSFIFRLDKYPDLIV
jgi:Glycosyl transferase family 2/Glycosyl transferases group 1